MGKIINGYIMPHPPIIVPGVGRSNETIAGATIQSVKRIAAEIARDNPSTIIITSPHAPCFRDYVYISDNDILSGSFAAFNCPQVRLSYENNTELVQQISQNARLSGLAAGGIGLKEKRQFGITGELDHGAMVPLYYISLELKGFKIVHISTPFLSFEELYKVGGCIRRSVEESDEGVVFVASGDLSHRLTQEAPAGYDPRGREYDEYMVNKLGNCDVEGLMKTDKKFIEAAGECGTRSFVMMLGALHGDDLKTDIYSYEGPYGVGYLAAKVNVTSRPSTHEVSHHVRLARETLETFIKYNKKISIPDWLPSDFQSEQAGVFVSLKINGQLRGCIGTISPTAKNMAEEIINNAISAGTRDPRFDPVKETELPELVYSVDVLGAPEPITSADQLDVKRYGVIVTSGYRRGLLLPDLEGIDTPEEQIEIALQKAGIRSNDTYSMERFEVIRYK